MQVDFSKSTIYGGNPCNTLHKCNNFENCQNVCISHIGYALANFLMYIDVLDSSIGNYSKDSHGKDLIVNGHMLFEDDIDGNLSSTLKYLDNSSINTGDKFRNGYTYSSTEVLNNFCKIAGVSNELTSELVAKLNDINKLKKIIKPLNPGLECNAELNMDDGDTIILKETKIHRIKWYVNDAGELQSLYSFETKQNGQSKIVTVSSDEYNLSFYSSQLDVAQKTKYERSLIRLTNNGYIKPIEVYKDDSSIVVDGSFIYKGYQGVYKIIGGWKPNGTIFIMNGCTDKFTKFIEKHQRFIAIHKRFIGPFVLCETNRVEYTTRKREMNKHEDTCNS